ncbi:shikimate kinase [Pseudalkalibacillus caeni]|uniref:Shikimate kinase n=1 Tax=Exobacillus caeni TaxID=2574798 RepID=A0A5R9F1Q5_9BACL|nr:shikimate kinase [Pseudalkalibacillus caeni]TLS36346.1 shikimate kinase [Pseudalkalibacillus caeni]
MKAIYLIGFMGAGKTTVGKALSDKLEVPVIDTDEYIEREKKKTIKAIFKEEGEPAFRDYESQILRMLPKRYVVITTGGGIVTREENLTWMKQNGLVIYLYCNTEELLKRLKNDKTRPLIQQNKEDAITRLLMDRAPLYKQAHFTIDTSWLNVDQVVSRIMEQID